jgi:hypothetical protein
MLFQKPIYKNTPIFNYFWTVYFYKITSYVIYYEVKRRLL